MRHMLIAVEHLRFGAHFPDRIIKEVRRLAVVFSLLIPCFAMCCERFIATLAELPRESSYFP